MCHSQNKKALKDLFHIIHCGVYIVPSKEHDSTPKEIDTSVHEPMMQSTHTAIADKQSTHLIADHISNVTTHFEKSRTLKKN